MVDILLAFSISFSWMKLLYVDSYFTEVCSWGLNWQYVIICSENRLSPSRRQAFTWTNDDHVLWCYMASLGHSELAWLGADESWMDVNVNTGRECIHWGDSETQNSWWRHQMETFSALLAICAGTSPVTGEFPAQRPVKRNFDVFFDLRLNKRLSKQSWGWWSQTPSRPWWRHSNVKRGRQDIILDYATLGQQPFAHQYVFIW